MSPPFTFRRFLLVVVLPLIIGFALGFAFFGSQAHAQNAATPARTFDRTPQEWNERIATTIVVGYFALKCPAVYPGVFYSPVKPAVILGAIQAEADDAALYQGLPAGFYYPEIRAVMASMDPKWDSMEEYKRRVACGNISVSYPGILKRVPTT
jgi:hypothetical protein